MKIYKSLFWVLIMVPILLTGFGCKKFLDRKPLTATLNDLNQGGLEAQSFGMYSTLRSYAGFSTLPWLDFHSIRDDDAQKGSSTTDGAEVVTEFDIYQYSKDDWAPNTYWNDRYYMINLANKSLYFADSLHATDPASLRNIGEAYFFRAYCYFDLVRTYGEVPLIDFYYTSAAAGIKPKSNVNAIYTLIDADLTKAVQYLPLNWEVAGTNRFPGRLTQGAAKTLWAQSYLFRSNWGRVVQLCNEVIASGQYQLLPNFVDIWKDGLNGAGKNGKESIFEMQASIGANGTNYYGVQWGTCQNVRQGGATNAWNLGWGWNTPTDNLVSAWDNTDPRKAATILYSGQSDGGPATGGYGATLPPFGPGTALDQKYWNKKVYSDPQMRQYTGEIGAAGGADWINHRILRYADVILMLAEAANEMNDGATAAANLEKIRNRASGNLGPTRTVLPVIPFTTQAAMRTAIKNERRWEFAMEGYRFLDLVRWGDAISNLGSLGYTNRCRFYPLPQQAINLSNNVLVQNPEWP
jgi:hypothetical protein